MIRWKCQQTYLIQQSANFWGLGFVLPLTKTIITKYSKFVKKILEIIVFLIAQRMVVKMSTIDKINYYLSKCGKNGAGLCEYLGVSSGVYSQWNTGRTSPRKSKLPMIAEYLGVSVSDLLPDTSEQGQEQQGIKKDPTQTGEVGKVELLRSLEETDDTKTLLDALDIINRKLQERK